MGFGVRKEVISFKVVPQKLLMGITLLNDKLEILKFVGPKPKSSNMAPNPKSWLRREHTRIL